MITLKLIYSMFFFFSFITFSYNLENRVYNGRDLRRNVHKYLVKLEIQQENTLFTCSGSIISRFWIISAAHCFNDEVNAKIFHHVNIKKQIAEANCVLTHPHFDKGTVNDSILTNEHILVDIALVKTVHRIQFNKYVQPITIGCWENFNRYGNIAGYGKSEPGLTAPREGQVRISKCWNDNIQLMCTKGKAQGGSGDSGGPLIASGILVGVTSANVINTSLTYYASICYNLWWINQVLKSNYQISHKYVIKNY
ncbi:anionic trypsin-2-like [Galleria mellonella]|uniref:Anionic trypsin-2-like n=1 Tax=Galleria mellonella TaxID=7137 RepID=A0A6J3CBG8_GALME|nr:anionic trypsin-2-like [Galleria mellonella]